MSRPERLRGARCGAQRRGRGRGRALGAAIAFLVAGAGASAHAEPAPYRYQAPITIDAPAPFVQMACRSPPTATSSRTTCATCASSMRRGSACRSPSCRRWQRCS